MRFFNTGEQVLKIFEECGVTLHNAPLLTGAITNILDVLSHLNIASAGNKGKGLTSMKELVDMLFLDGSGINAQDKMKLYYRFHVSQIESKFGGGKDTQFNLWCFHPGFSMASLVKCNIRTLVLTSGTLKPMDSFQAELSAEFSVKLQNEHVIDAKKQINYQVISRGPDGQEFLATFANRSNLKYLTSLGQSLVEIAKGLLIWEECPPSIFSYQTLEPKLLFLILIVFFHNMMTKQHIDMHLKIFFVLL